MDLTGDILALELASSILCKRWKLGILAALNAGCERFSELEEILPECSAKVLSSQLKALERDQLITRIPHRGYRCYALSGAGRQLAVSLRYLADWGVAYVRECPDAIGKHGLAGLKVRV